MPINKNQRISPQASLSDELKASILEDIRLYLTMITKQGRARNSKQAEEASDLYFAYTGIREKIRGCDLCFHRIYELLKTILNKNNINI